MVSSIYSEMHIFSNPEDSRVISQEFPSLDEAYCSAGSRPQNPRNGVISEQELAAEIREKIKGCSPEIKEGSTLCPDKSQISDSGRSGSNPSTKDWRSLFSTSRSINPNASLKFTSPSQVNGKLVIAAQSKSFAPELKKCENMVVGYFVGKRLSFSSVQVAVRRLWKFKKEVRIKLYDNCAFIFEFDDDDDRNIVLETGSVYIANQLFTLRPWSLLLEKSVSKCNAIPIWVLIYGIPIHMWGNEGLGLISSFLGKPLLADNCTINQDRLAYARICVEIDAQFTFPDKIPLVIDDTIELELPVEYPWRPAKCETCLSFGHTVKNCTRKTKKSWIPKKVISPAPISNTVKNGEDSFTSAGGLEPVKESGLEVEGRTRDAVATPFTVVLEKGSETDLTPDVSVEKDSLIRDAEIIMSEIADKVCSAEVAKVVVENSQSSPVRKKGDSPSGKPRTSGNAAGNLNTYPGAAGSSKDEASTKASSKDGDAVRWKTGRDLSSVDKEGEWTSVKGKKLVRHSPKKNPFMVYSDFKAESRFPINRKLEDEEFENKFKYLSEEEKILKKQERETRRLKWNGNSDFKGDSCESAGRGMKAQQKKK